MEGINFTKKHNILDLVLSGQKTMFRIPARKKKGGHLFDTTKYSVGDKIAVLQSYKDAGYNPNDLLSVLEGNVKVHNIPAKDTKGWSKTASADPTLMPHVIQITNVKTEKVQNINDSDCRLEGIVPVAFDDLKTLDGCMPFEGYSLDGKTWLGDNPQEVFKSISDIVVKKDAWKNNTLVECYTFRLIQ